VQKRAYRWSAPAVRNSRPKTVFNSDSATVFNSRLKTFLFSRAFSLPFTLPGPGSYDLMALYKCVYYYYFFMAAGRKTRLDIQTYGCNSNLLCDHGVAERNRISSLQSHRKALEKECCLPGVFCDSGDTPAYLLCELSGHLYGK